MAASTWMGCITSLWDGELHRQIKGDAMKSVHGLISSVVDTEPGLQDYFHSCCRQIGTDPASVSLLQTRGDTKLLPIAWGRNIVIDYEHLKERPWGAGRLLVLEKLALVRHSGRERLTLYAGIAFGGASGLGTIALRRYRGKNTRHLRYAWPAALAGWIAGVVWSGRTEYVRGTPKQALEEAMQCIKCGDSLRELAEHEDYMVACMEQAKDAVPRGAFDMATASLKQNAPVGIELHSERAARVRAFLDQHPDVAQSRCAEQEALAAAARNPQSPPPPGCSAAQVALKREALKKAEGCPAAAA
eukprot:TRINITY_DN5903_c0_g3_i1.p1 TRINITY_DN5903_c0_g3~~TRINITY_DN5903_c0_g3_i1.p1  ORF type:complete len:332 (+),score=84.64 TRINITY_DN5903_c0_g3_i1:92-997(+)